MNVSFYSLDDYFTEIDRLKTEGECPFVRAETFTMKRDEDGGVTDIQVISGFPCGEHYYELQIACEEILAGDKDPAGVKQAKEVIGIIKDKCESLGFGFGGGRWQP